MPRNGRRLCRHVLVQQTALITMAIRDLVQLQSPSLDLLRGRLHNLEDWIHVSREWNEPMITFRGCFPRTENSDYRGIPPMIVVHQVDNQLMSTTSQHKKADTAPSLYHHIDGAKLIKPIRGGDIGAAKGFKCQDRSPCTR